MKRPHGASRTRRGLGREGFTLAEAAVTIAIVAIVLTMILQALEVAKITAAHTMYMKAARELGSTMLGEIEAGRWQDELDSGMSGSFADKDQPDYYWDLALGDESFPDRVNEDQDDRYKPFDNYRARDEWRADNSDPDEDEEEQPFEKIKLRVRFPKIRQLSDEIVLERWVRWAQIYGKDEEEEAAAGAADPNAAGGGAPAETPGG
ncbi:MAG: prepilin-type N-terminal cleavage/methylation domain-containing protein [Planctomycetota bacterium]